MVQWDVTVSTFATFMFMETTTETIHVNSPETLNTLMDRVKAAQKIYATYSQEQIDEIFRTAALAAASNRIPLVKAAVEETRMGIAGMKERHKLTFYHHFASARLGKEGTKSDDGYHTKLRKRS